MMGFPWPKPGKALDQIPTPMPIVDEDRMAANIARAQGYCNENGLTFRPHIKTHKILSLAHQQLAAGAIGINCQKISEAEAFANAGFQDILITYNMVDAVRIRRLRTMLKHVARLAVTADHKQVVDMLGKAFNHSDRPLSVLVECDTGAGRCGVQTPDEAARLAKHIAAYAGLSFRGILTYPAKGHGPRVEAFFRETVEKLAQAGLKCPVRSIGGTPDLWGAHLVPSANECRAGTYIFNDRTMLEAGACARDDVALHVLATVVSRPTPTRAILDCGSKALTPDPYGFDDYGEIEELPGAKIVKLSEEHAIVDLTDCRVPLPDIGQRVRVMPNHCCVVANLFDCLVFYRGQHVTRVERLAARGMVW